MRRWGLMILWRKILSICDSSYRVQGQVGHGVPDYLADPVVRDMLRDSGVTPSGEPPAGAPRPIVRRSTCSAAGAPAGS